MNIVELMRAIDEFFAPDVARECCPVCFGAGAVAVPCDELGARERCVTCAGRGTITTEKP